MVKKIIEVTLITLFQIVGLIVVNNIFYYLYPIQNKEVNFGITIYCTEIIFVVLIFTYNFYIEFYKKHIYLIAVIFLIIVSILPMMSINFRPFRSLFLIFLAKFGFISSIIISKWRSSSSVKSL